MAADPTPPADAARPPAPSAARYHGPAGAFAYFLLLVAMGAVLTGFAGAAMWMATNDATTALYTAVRAALFLGTAALGAALARLICRGETDRLITRRLIRGDLAAVFGIVLGVLLAGYLTEHVLTPPDGGPVAGKAAVQRPGRLPPEREMNPLRWWFVAMLRSPEWLLPACCLGAVVLFALAEAGLRGRARPAATGA